jgi:hypothetical protein
VSKPKAPLSHSVSGNPAALLLTMITSWVDESEVDSWKAMVPMAANAWMEGHIAAEIDRGLVPVPFDAADPYEPPPSPPWPEASEPLLDEIHRAATESLGSAPHPGQRAGFLFAVAGMAWNYGYTEGRSCPGCLRPGDPRINRLRESTGATKLELRIREKQP